MLKKRKLTIAVLIVVALGGVAWYRYTQSTTWKPQVEEGDIVLHNPCGDLRKKAGVLPTGQVLFIAPDCSFSFQYFDENGMYGIEKILNDRNVFAVCNALRCYSVGVDIRDLALSNTGQIVYDYTPQTYDRETPDIFQKIKWNGYPAFKAIFAHAQFPERLFFIHIPHNKKLFTLFRSTTDQEIVFRQFSLISETFTLSEER